jgi:energy-coupling factor transporter ATP-binding protein EcfA2
MRLKNVAVKNFRLLKDIDLVLETGTTVVVGRNNSGKTSLTEVMRRLLEDSSPTFRLEDFSFGTHEAFWAALNSFLQGADDDVVRQTLPIIEIQLTFEYKIDEALGALSEFVIDLDPNCTEALIVASYGLKDGKVKELFTGLGVPDAHATEEQVNTAKLACFKSLRDRIPELFMTTFVAVDPNDSENNKIIEGAALRRLCGSGFIGAQRGLDDVSQKDRAVIGKVLENLFATAKNNTTDADGHPFPVGRS